MIVSLAVVPLLKDEAAKSLMKTLEVEKLKPYTEEERLNEEKHFLRLGDFCCGADNSVQRFIDESFNEQFLLYILSLE